jgi:hypothetical protein
MRNFELRKGLTLYKKLINKVPFFKVTSNFVLEKIKQTSEIPIMVNTLDDQPTTNIKASNTTSQPLKHQTG